MFSLENALKHYVYFIVWNFTCKLNSISKQSGIHSASPFWNLNIAIIS